MDANHVLHTMNNVFTFIFSESNILSHVDFHKLLVSLKVNI